MKKCMRCKIVFHRAERTRCLYCDGLLTTVNEDDSVTESALPPQDTAVIELIVRDRDQLTHENMKYIIGSYFKSRTFNFMYTFSRNELKMGKTYKRFLVQPLNFSSLFMIPWMVVNFIDSLFFRLVYQNYCSECNWKYAGGSVRHDPKECAYNREYMLVINAVLTGQIARLEETFQYQAMNKIKNGQRSAYFDLCARKNKYEGVLDVACVWFSLGLIVYGIVVALMPLLMYIIKLVGKFEREEFF